VLFNWYGWGGRSRWAAARRDAQESSKTFSTCCVIVWVAAMAVGVDIIQRVRYQAFVSQRLFLGAAVAAVAVRAAVFQSMNAVPLAILVHRILFRMAGDTG